MQSGNPAIEELFARMSTAILIDPSEGAMNSLPSTLKDIFKKIVQKLKSLYKGLIGEFNNRNFAPRTLEDAVLSIYQNGNTYTATDNLNQRVRYADELNYSDKVEEGQDYWEKGTVKEFFTKYRDYITEVIEQYPKTEVEGVTMLEGLLSGDMPYEKELIASQLYQDIFNSKDFILLPRYANNLISDVFGVNPKRGSLPDGIEGISKNGEYVEFKIISEKNLVKRINESENEADISFVIVDNISERTKNKFEKNPQLNIGDNLTVYILDSSNNKVYTLEQKKSEGTNKWSLVGCPDYLISTGKENLLSLIKDYMHGPEDVKTAKLIDYEKYKNKDASNGESINDTSSQSQYNSVRNQYYGTSEWLKAPNGKNTKLTEEQWIQVRTPNFIKWFGDWINDPDNASKVVDENGEPKPVKHGTPNKDFESFDLSKTGSNTDAGWLGKGFYFYGNADAYASQYAGKDGRVIEAFLNIRDPYYISESERRNLIESDSLEASEEFRDELIDEGYDGVFYNGDLDEEWTTFDPNQIKSATENNGDFSTEDTRFRYSEELDDNDTQDYGDTFNVDNPKSITNRNIGTWDTLVD